MSRISEAFANEKALVAYITAGDPSLEVTEKLLMGIQEAGADLVLIGLPFEDIKVESTIIHESNQRALTSGITTDDVFLTIKKISEQAKIPFVFMTYYVTIASYGKEDFMRKCIECGVRAILVADIPYGEEAILDKCMNQYGIERITVVSPSSREQIQRIAKNAKGFIYCAPSRNLSALSTNHTADLDGMIAAIRAVTETPCALGFGAVGLDQAKAMAAKADGVIVGTAIVRMIAEQQENSMDFLKSYVRSMKSAILRA